jgi:hypothetical protein
LVWSRGVVGNPGAVAERDTGPAGVGAIDRGMGGARRRGVMRHDRAILNGCGRAGHVATTRRAGKASASGREARTIRYVSVA